MNSEIFIKLSAIHPNNAKYCLETMLQFEGQTFYVNQTKILICHKDKEDPLFVLLKDVLDIDNEEIVSFFPALNVDIREINAEPDLYIVPTNIIINEKGDDNMQYFLSQNNLSYNDCSGSCYGWRTVNCYSQEGFISLFERLTKTAPEGLKLMTRRIAEITYF